MYIRSNKQITYNKVLCKIYLKLIQVIIMGQSVTQYTTYGLGLKVKKSVFENVLQKFKKVVYYIILLGGN
jgi:hypothetical protein